MSLSAARAQNAKYLGRVPQKTDHGQRVFPPVQIILAENENAPQVLTRLRLPLLPNRVCRTTLTAMKLRLVVEHDPETKRWAAFFPELPGCASAGDTEEEAVLNAKEALALWFEPADVSLPAGAKVVEVALT